MHAHARGGRYVYIVGFYDCGYDISLCKRSCSITHGSCCLLLRLYRRAREVLTPQPPTKRNQACGSRSQSACWCRTSLLQDACSGKSCTMFIVLHVQLYHSALRVSYCNKGCLATQERMMAEVEVAQQERDKARALHSHAQARIMELKAQLQRLYDEAARAVRHHYWHYARPYCSRCFGVLCCACQPCTAVQTCSRNKSPFANLPLPFHQFGFFMVVPACKASSELVLQERQLLVRQVSIVPMSLGNFNHALACSTAFLEG